MKDQQKAEEIAAQRMQLLSPLLADGLDAAKIREIKKGICQQKGGSLSGLLGSLTDHSEVKTFDNQ